MFCVFFKWHFNFWGQALQSQFTIWEPRWILLINVRYKTALKANYAFRQIYIITFFSRGKRFGLSMPGMQTILISFLSTRSSSLAWELCKNGFVYAAFHSYFCHSVTRYSSKNTLQILFRYFKIQATATSCH